MLAQPQRPETRVTLADLHLVPTAAACTETTLTMQQPRSTNARDRLQWRARAEDAAATHVHGDPAAAAAAAAVQQSAGCTVDAPVVLGSLDIRTFVLSAS